MTIGNLWSQECHLRNEASQTAGMRSCPCQQQDLCMYHHLTCLVCKLVFLSYHPISVSSTSLLHPIKWEILGSALTLCSPFSPSSLVKYLSVTKKIFSNACNVCFLIPICEVATLLLLPNTAATGFWSVVYLSCFFTLPWLQFMLGRAARLTYSKIFLSVFPTCTRICHFSLLLLASIVPGSTETL